MKFKQFLKEQEQKFKIFLDMDGCISSFVEHTEKTFNVNFKDFLKDDDKFWSSIHGEGEKFWSEMPPMKDYKELITFLEKNGGYTILTSTGTPNHATKEAESGKKKWVKKYLGNVPVIIEHSKYKYASPNAILIDDLDKNIKPWIAKGGIGVLHKNAKDTIKQLKEILGV